MPLYRTVGVTLAHDWIEVGGRWSQGGQGLLDLGGVYWTRVFHWPNGPAMTQSFIDGHAPLTDLNVTGKKMVTVVLSASEREMS